MKLIIGLGNPGKEYETTRHNVGFMTVEHIAETCGFANFGKEEKFEAEIAAGNINNEKILLAKPQTFMNSSGKSVQKMMSFYKISTDELIVIHDDLDIPVGEFRLAMGSRSAGHKGVQSIIDLLGTNKFHRVRIGIKIEERKIPTEKFVLGNFDKNELEKINSVIDETIAAIEKELIK
jgi:PTH1 family peptidyl-tRNA hydrolase